MQLPKEYTVKLPLERGSKGAAVKLLQEWLCLSDCKLSIDGSFGAATEATVRKFQTKARISATGIVDEEAWNALLLPLRNATRPLSTTAETFAQRVVAAARQHLKSHPMEIGGQNAGPWVRLYMNGKEGKDWPWCAGFVTYILAQASEGSKVDRNPLKPTASCDILASQAADKEILLTEKEIAKDAGRKALLRPGALFLVRAAKTSTDYTHTGIVTAVHDEYFETVEGNTNDDGDREGYEVCRRLRGYGNKDFIIL
ncbi:hypothetical protein BH10BAC6_BH10BAC6_13380 [soil metagenome]